MAVDLVVLAGPEADVEHDLGPGCEQDAGNHTLPAIGGMDECDHGAPRGGDRGNDQRPEPVPAPRGAEDRQALTTHSSSISCRISTR